MAKETPGVDINARAENPALPQLPDKIRRFHSRRKCGRAGTAPSDTRLREGGIAGIPERFGKGADMSNVRLLDGF
jgi:hypothetical protein